jgi:hypothetical protein
MPYQVKVNDPNQAEGVEVVVPGLGVFRNKSTRQISDDEAEAYRDNTSRLVDVETDDRPVFSGAAGVELRRGPDVLEAFKDHPVVSVTQVSEKKPPAKAEVKEG